MSETRLAILSLLRHKRLHGYEIKKTLERECIDMWSSIPLATLYNELTKMSREGLVEKLGVQVKSGRARSVYGITERGRSAFLEMVREAWRSEQPVPIPLFVAVTAGTPSIALIGEQQLPAYDLTVRLATRRN